MQKNILGQRNNPYIDPPYGKDYKQCRIYRMMGFPKKATINDFGREYNKHFIEEINNKILPKYGRNQARSMNLGVWFFENILDKIYPWLKDTGKLYVM